jgi:type 2 lantibiotic biosynthesis protein LanM
MAERAAALGVARADRRTRRAASSRPAPAIDRLARWRRQRPFDRPDVFARRLRLDDLTEQDFRELLDGQVDNVTSENDVPEWVMQVRRTDAIAREIARSPTRHASPDPNGLEPVRAFVEPFVTAGMARLYSAAKAIVIKHPSAPFDPQHATRLFEPLLWSHLAGRAMKVVILELNVARIRGTLVGDTPEERCAHFASQLRDSATRDALIAEYPVLARSLVTAAEYWANAADEFLRHLAMDTTLLREAFAGASDLGVLTNLIGNAGDAHRHGRSVMVVELSSGVRVVYKPRSLAVDCHFNGLIDWINAHGQAPALRVVQTIDVGDHGWAELVTNEPCDSIEAVARFYDRFGAFLAILYALNATDFHYENVIASGEFPMLIDLEALFHPLTELAVAADEPEWLGWEALQRSVLRTGALPFRAYDTEQSSGLDMSAMGGSGGQQTPNRFPVLVAPGTDEMRLERDFIRLPAAHNRPTLGGRPVDPAAFGERLRSGFASTYRLLLAHRDELLAPDGPIHRFAVDPIRVVLRPTRQYALILSESHHPDVMRDAVERDRLIDRLWVGIPARPELERVVRWEHDDLVNGDVPLFTSTPASRDLATTHGTVIPDYFRRSGLGCALERIESMSERDLLRQQWVIEASLVALRPWHHDGAQLVRAESLPLAPAGDWQPSRPSRDETLRAAQRVARRLASLALRDEDRTSWLGLTLVRERDWAIQPIGTDLYSGTAGIALFLAYADHVLHDGDSRAPARAVVHQIDRRISATLDAIGPEAPLPPGSLGAFSALGGAVYVFSHLGILWNDRRLLDSADRIVGALRKQIASDDQLDVIGGTAGFIMAVAALERAFPSDENRAALAEAADSLVSRAERVEAGLAWRTRLPSSRPLAGLSHGASGMALALATASQVLGCARYGDAAVDAMRYERSLLDVERGNWPDYRILDGRGDADGPSLMWAWCHGAPGIGLARLAALGVASQPDVIADLATALESTAHSGFGSNDSLCHGDLGNLELLMRARELGHRGGWETALPSQSSRLVERIARGEWRCGIPGGVETPGFMTGLAGVGYGLLRLAAPERVPSVLSLEPPRLPGVAGSSR